MANSRQAGHQPKRLAFLSLKQVIEKTALSRATLYRLRSSGDFPEPRQLSAKRVGWLLSDVEEWIESRRPAGEIISAKNGGGRRRDS